MEKVTAALLSICPDFPKWPERWKGVEQDLVYGRELLQAMRPFAEHLAQGGLSKKTIKNHLDNLWLLGGEIIRSVSIDNEYSKPAAEKLKSSVGTDGGPDCRHLDSEEESRSFDSTCRKLHKFLESAASQNDGDAKPRPSKVTTMANPKKSKPDKNVKGHRGTVWVKTDDRLFILEVFLIDGPITEEFGGREISRTIEMHAQHTLQTLHHAIFNAYDRFDEHMYEFQLGGKGPMDPKARRYVLPGEFSSPLPGLRSRKPAGDVKRTAIGSIGLKVGDTFGYWFDFGDDWWHQINVKAIVEGCPDGEYPKITKRVGQSPPQYPDLDEDN